MKKLLICVLIFALLMPFTAFAAIDVTVSEKTENSVNVSGTAKSGEKVFLIVLNDDKTEDDVKNGTDNALIYAKTQMCNSDGGYSFDFTISNSDGGDGFTAIVSWNDGKETKVFTFFPKKAKEDFMEEMQECKIGEDEFASAAAIFGLNDFPLTDKAKFSEYAAILSDIRDDLGGLPSDTNGFANAVKAAIVLYAYNNGDERVFSGEDILYADSLGLTELDEYEEYKSKLNSDGRSNTQKALLENTYTDLTDFYKAFKEKIYVECIVNYYKLGYAHVEDYLDKYSEQYGNAGFKLGKLDNVSNTKLLYSELADLSVATLSELSSEFNSLVSKYSSSKSSGGGGRVSSGGSGGSGYIVPTVNPNDTADEESVKITFCDVEEDFWAEEYIYSLARKKIIYGKGNDIFAPFESVTRAELATMLVRAFELDTSLTSSFADVAGTWCEPYVAAAEKAGIVNGISETRFAPNEIVTREQAATMVARAMGLTEAENINVFVDDGEISDYSKTAVYALKELKIIEGRSDGGLFMPKEPLSRAEAAKIIFCMLGNL